MSKDDISLKDLMDEIQQMPRTESSSEDTASFESSGNYYRAGEMAEELADLDGYIQSRISEITTLPLSDKAREIITEFLTFHLQRSFLLDNLPEGFRTYYNLLLRCDELAPAKELVEKLRLALQKHSRSVFSRSEEAMLDTYETITSKRSTSRTPTPQELIPRYKEILFIHSCKRAPLLDNDLGTGSAMEANRKKTENYRNMWQELTTYALEHPNVILIVQADSSVYRGSLQLNTELFYRICGHHIFLQPVSMESLFSNCIQRLKDSSFTLCKNFEKHLHAYFTTIYPKAELKGQAFVEDLICRIYALYFCKKRKSRILSLDCIPRYNPQVISAEDILGQMDELVGLQRVKDTFRDLYTMQLAGIQQSGKQRYHMLFTGGPGTGKTTVANMVADLFYRMNILKSNKLVVAKATDLMSLWQSGTGKKATDLIHRAYDGVLFIDEAYGLVDNPKGPEALNILIQEMEENSHRLVVILAGYKAEMEKLVSLNPGLSSRIGREIAFDDYTLEELVRIFHFCCKNDGFALDPSADEVLEDCISNLMTREFFGNARDITKLLQGLKEAWASQRYELSKTAGDQVELERVFYPQHFQKLMPPKKPISIQELVGLNTLKGKLDAFKTQVLYQKHLKEKGLPGLGSSSMHMIFTGNPGTGKTTVARSIADDLYSIGVLKSNRLVIAERKDLVSPIPGQTAIKTQEVIKKAAGGVLFIDEAYSLAHGNLGYEVIEVLLTAMEDHKADTVFIFAGYSDEMQTFLDMNPGIQSRIAYTFHFEDYSPDELTKMYEDKLLKAGFTVTKEALERVRGIMEYFHGAKNFGNGRFVNHVLQQTVTQRAARDFTQQYRDITEQDIPDIKTLIATAPNGMHLYDPAEITQQQYLRTAVHELGHAIMIRETDPERVPECISIRNQAGSFGRVTVSTSSGNATEQELFNLLCVLLAGKNAERVVFGDHSVGCFSDYTRAKHLAGSMLERYAMDHYGDTEAAICKAANAHSMEILARYKDLLPQYAQVLLEKQQMTGEEFLQLIKQS